MLKPDRALLSRAPPPPQVVTAVVLATGFQGHTVQNLPASTAVVALVFICFFVAGFAW